MKKFIEIVGNLLIEAIQLGSSVVLEFGVSPVRLKQAGSQRRVNPFKEFEKDQANGIALRAEPIATRFGEFFDQVLGSQFAQIVAKGSQAVLVG